MESNNVIAQAIYESFKKWGSRDRTYFKTYKKLNEDTHDVFRKALVELNDHRPGTWDSWYVKEHMRFRHVKNSDMRILYQLVYIFLTKYLRGQLNDEVEYNNNKKKKSSTRKKIRA